MADRVLVLGVDTSVEVADVDAVDGVVVDVVVEVRDGAVVVDEVEDVEVTAVDVEVVED